MGHDQVRRVMHEWKEAGLLPDALVAHLPCLFPKPPPETVRMHLVAFDWWRREPREDGARLRLAALLQRLDLEPADREWMTQAIR
jgi:hypothetical protein